MYSEIIMEAPVSKRILNNSNKNEFSFLFGFIIITPTIARRSEP